MTVLFKTFALSAGDDRPAIDVDVAVRSEFSKRPIRLSMDGVLRATLSREGAVDLVRLLEQAIAAHAESAPASADEPARTASEGTPESMSPGAMLLAEAARRRAEAAKAKAATRNGAPTP
jgi:hypothetical protein